MELILSIDIKKQKDWKFDRCRFKFYIKKFDSSKFIISIPL